MLRGLGYVLHQPRSTSESWLPLATRLLTEHGEWDVNDEPKIDKFLSSRQERRRIENEEEDILRNQIMK